MKISLEVQFSPKAIRKELLAAGWKLTNYYAMGFKGRKNKEDFEYGTRLSWFRPTTSGSYSPDNGETFYDWSGWAMAPDSLSGNLTELLESQNLKEQLATLSRLQKATQPDLITRSEQWGCSS